MRAIWKRNKVKVPYQTVVLKGKKYPGRFDTPKVFGALDIKRVLPGRSFVDLGCNRGGLVFLAEECGALTTVGVDVSEKNVEEAGQIGREGGSSSRFYCASIQDFVPTMDQFDIVVCMAVFRHLYADLLHEFDSKAEKKKGFLVRDSLDVLIRQDVGHPPEVISRYNQLIEAMLEASRDRFICSYNDESGLILRRQQEVSRFFRDRTDRVESIEVFLADYKNPKFVVVDIKLKAMKQSLRA